MKKNFLTLLLTGASLIIGSSLRAQNTCLNASSIGLSTGYNYSTGSVVTPGNPDPEWKITNLTPGMAAISGASAVGSAATVIDATFITGWATSTSSGWVSFLNVPSFYTPLPNDSLYYGMTISRQFKTCKTDNFKFSFAIAVDNFCKSIKIDGVSIGFSQNAGVTSTNYSAFATASYTASLSPGTHTIDVTVYNFPASGSSNPFGVNFQGSVSSATGSTSLVSPKSSENCVCMNGCSDSCYWKVYGNSILNGNNIFGTLSPDAIRIQTSATDRGIITKNGLFGWNTSNPTAYLHVNCNGNNPADGTISDVRFENLEPGAGNVLVISRDGYVTDSRIDISQLQADNEKLKTQVADLNSRIQMLTSGGGVTATTSKSMLYQNNPNPFNNRTSISFFVDQLNKGAYIGIYDMNGKELKRYNVTNKGNGSVDIDDSNLVSGMYLYSLVVDGQIVDTKKMTLAK